MQELLPWGVLAAFIQETNLGYIRVCRAIAEQALGEMLLRCFHQSFARQVIGEQRSLHCLYSMTGVRVQ